jgi:STE24 endopeptidase
VSGADPAGRESRQPAGFAARAYTARDASFVDLTLLFTAALVGSLLVKFWLTTRQVRHVAAHRHAVPEAFRQTVALAAHQRAADYTLAKSRFGLLVTAFGAAVLIGWTLLGGLDTLNAGLRDAIQPRFRQPRCTSSRC